MKKILVLIVGFFLCSAGFAQASNITIPDKNFLPGNTSWAGPHEDQEVEPGMETGQKWDLEGFFLNGTQLSLVGGYDLKNGYKNFFPGDIFIDVNLDAVFGRISGPQKTNGNFTVANSFGYDYVLDLDWTSADGPSYDVYQIGTQAQVSTAYYAQNQGSSPWRYVSGGTKISHGKITYKSDLAVDTDFYGTKFKGGPHNELVVDLGFLLGSKDVDFITHYTMGCGNDNIIGQGKLFAPPPAIPNPEPATMMLLGFGLLGVAGLGRKKLS